MVKKTKTKKQQEARREGLVPRTLEEIVPYKRQDVSEFTKIGIENHLYCRNYIDFECQKTVDGCDGYNFDCEFYQPFDLKGYTLK